MYTYMHIEERVNVNDEVSFVGGRRGDKRRCGVITVMWLGLKDR
mgnify:FL=1